jgi:hypothetical protein
MIWFLDHSIGHSNQSRLTQSDQSHLRMTSSELTARLALRQKEPSAQSADWGAATKKQKV